MQKKFITFEGGEGVGKTTQISLLQKAFISVGTEVLITREPGGTVISEDIRDLVLKSGKNGIQSVISETLLFYAARMEHIEQKITPALKNGNYVICDRFHDSSHVYQHFAKSVPKDFLKFLDDVIIGDYVPATTFLLDLPVDIALSRRNDRNKYSDKFELEPPEFHEIIRQGFLSRALEFPHRIVVIDAKNDVVEVSEQIVSVCKTRGIL